MRILLVAINKMDDPTVEWSQERFEECRDKLMPFLKGCGYNVKKDIVVIPLSAYTAQNIIKPVGDAAPWYDGPTFLACLDALPSLERNKSAPLRLPILSKYKDLGTVVEGKVRGPRPRVPCLPPPHATALRRSVPSAGGGGHHFRRRQAVGHA